MENSILLQNISPNEFAELINSKVCSQIENYRQELQTKAANDELLTRKEACEFLKIDSSTLWHWTNKGKVKAYGIANRRYYKRSELLGSLKALCCYEPKK